MTTFIKNAAGKLLKAEGLLWNTSTAPDCDCPCYDSGFCSDFTDLKRVTVKGSGTYKFSATVTHAGASGAGWEIEPYNESISVGIPIPSIIAVWTYDSTLSSSNKYILVRDNWSNNEWETTGLWDVAGQSYVEFSQLGDIPTQPTITHTHTGMGATPLYFKKRHKKEYNGRDETDTITVWGASLQKVLSGCSGSCCPGLESIAEVSGISGSNYFNPFFTTSGLYGGGVNYVFTYSIEWPTTSTHLNGT